MALALSVLLVCLHLPARDIFGQCETTISQDLDDKPCQSSELGANTSVLEYQLHRYFTLIVHFPHFLLLPCTTTLRSKIRLGKLGV